ncbi:MAG: bifunctional folylpolyglutamate synthase/dihydrofolate synthase [Desulfobacteraceae bacterium]|nr:bifunctional folylpolyglutamate synthase/dihydrofolate synthase [Desulfobacteraceae bacterium]
MNYPEALSLLDSLQMFKIKLGLESMTRFMERLGAPHRRLAYIHLAGTNGKGSVAATLLALLVRAGFRVGCYTSPHLSSVRERFRINGDYIGQEDFVRHARRIVEVLAGEQITYFEFTTALALLWFAEREVDYAILETGMGGRLDATNIVTPRVAVITNVELDHQAYLGATRAAIAGEKAGIIKPGVPVVSGARGPSAGQVIGETAAGRGAPLFLLGRDFRLEEEPGAGLVYAGLKARCPGLSLALRGAHQVENAALALAALELLETGRGLDCQVAREGLLQVCWPGRLEYFPGLTWRGRKRDVLLDGAHNPAGVESLLAALGADFADRRLIVVWASMADKDFAACLAAMAGHCQRIVLTRPESLRSATPEQLRLALPEALRERAVAAPGVEEALSLAYGLAGAGELICVAGSLYLVGKARALLAGELAGD